MDSIIKQTDNGREVFNQSDEHEQKLRQMLWLRENKKVQCPFCAQVLPVCFTEDGLFMCRNDRCHQAFTLNDRKARLYNADGTQSLILPSSI